MSPVKLSNRVPPPSMSCITPERAVSLGTKVHSAMLSIWRISSPMRTAVRAGTSELKYTVMTLLPSTDCMVAEIFKVRSAATPVISRQAISTPMEAILMVRFFQRLFRPSRNR